MAHKVKAKVKSRNWLQSCRQSKKLLSGYPASAQRTQAGSFHKKCTNANLRATVLAHQLLGTLIRMDWPGESMRIDRQNSCRLTGRIHVDWPAESCGLTGRIHVGWPTESMWIDRQNSVDRPAESIWVDRQNPMDRPAESMWIARYDIRITVSAVSPRISTKWNEEAPDYF